ncbi:Glyoxylase, beta-lactamase superfamily II [Alkalithermobacter thermoalcaliphilus JW-YL-7 = DSM 7308]|uniref:Beta-lactamase domain protein n=1 Tax=Alkalithermobacter thermoalcaliphilus JW-YL-7 = DSM 7308 TaxID=1121328 RepID=A0A150FNJ0_CLOPD|nr:beta-lactamase domain protein [[Clostridium] paradoxum JW-YL-7 = DSM 7308]SHK92327.1 Glyoxylase, beta-lactamase superfamily II [[Clostridium] paradoxum JW-YL-7 = DSM 7308]
MKLEKIQGKSYYIKGGTNTGVYIFENKSVLIIDPGLSDARGKRLVKFFENENLNIKYIINTHEHSDHYGATKFILDSFKGSRTFSSYDAKLVIENPYIFNMYTYGGKSSKFFDENFKNRGQYFRVDEVLSEGEVFLEDEYFEIIDLKGHSIGQIGVITKDKVLYLGDSLLDKEILEKFNFPFIIDVASQIKTLEKIKKLDFDFAVIGHRKELLDKEETLDLAQYNIDLINKYIDYIKLKLRSLCTQQDLLAYIINDHNLKLNYKEYYFSKSTLASMISYLAENENIDYKIDDGKIYYYLKK